MMKVGVIVAVLAGATVMVACSSFSGDQPGTVADAGGADGGSEGSVVTGTSDDKTFALVAPTARTYLVQGQTVTVTINLTRGPQVAGPVTLMLKNLPTDVTTTATAIPEDVDVFEITFTATADAVQEDLQIGFDATTMATDGTALTTSGTFDLFVRGPSGSLDTTFGTNGHFAPESGTDDNKELVYVGPKDDLFTIVADGTGTCVKHYSADGASDMSFGTSGCAGVRKPTLGVVQPDGSFVTLGLGINHPVVLFRFTPKGMSDTNFGDGSEGVGSAGFADPAGTISAVSGIGLAADGSFAATYLYSVSEAMIFTGVARLGKTGALITTFGGTGFAAWRPDFAPPNPLLIDVKSTGAVLLAGVNKPTTGNTYNVIQFTPAGAPDTGFGFNGTLSQACGNNSFDVDPEHYGNAIFSDGSFVFPCIRKLVKINAAGQFDLTFGASGSIDLTDYVYAVAGTPDQRFVVLTNDAGGAAVYRYNADGSFDNKFGAAGKINITATFNQRGRILVQSDGRIVVLASNDIQRIWN